VGVSECCPPETLRRLHDANSSSRSWMAGEKLWRFTLKGTHTPSDSLRHTPTPHIHTHSRRIKTDTRTEHMEKEDYVLMSEASLYALSLRPLKTASTANSLKRTRKSANMSLQSRRTMTLPEGTSTEK